MLLHDKGKLKLRVKVNHFSHSYDMVEWMDREFHNSLYYACIKGFFFFFYKSTRFLGKNNKYIMN